MSLRISQLVAYTQRRTGTFRNNQTCFSKPCGILFIYFMIRRTFLQIDVSHVFCEHNSCSFDAINKSASLLRFFVLI